MLGFPDRFRRWPWRCIGIVAAILGVLLGAGYVVFRLHGMDIRTPVRLPFAHYGEVLDLDHAHFVHLTADGEVLLGRERVTLDELTARTSRDKRPVVICADADARALNLWYVQGACAGSATYLAVDDGWRTAVIPTYRREYAVWPVEIVGVGPVSGTPTASGHSLQYGVWNSRGELVASVEDAIDGALESIEQDDAAASSVTPPGGRFDESFAASLSCAGNASVSAYMMGVDIVYGLDAKAYMTLELRASPWTCRQASLPTDVGTYPILLNGLGVEDLSWELSLEPPAARVVSSDDHDEGVRVQVSQDGKLYWRLDPRSLGEFAEILGKQATLFDEKQSSLGKPRRDGPGNRFSTLPLRLRVDRNRSWGSIRDLLHLAYASGVRRHVLHVLTRLDWSWSREDREVFGSFRVDAPPLGPPPPVGVEEFLFELPLTWDAGAAAEGVEIRIDRSSADGSTLYTVGDRPATNDAVQRERHIEDLARGTTVRLVIDPAIPLWRIVELIDFLRSQELVPLLEPFPDEVPPELLARERLR